VPWFFSFRYLPAAAPRPVLPVNLRYFMSHVSGRTSPVISYRPPNTPQVILFIQDRKMPRLMLCLHFALSSPTSTHPQRPIYPYCSRKYPRHTCQLCRICMASPPCAALTFKGLHRQQQNLAVIAADLNQRQRLLIASNGVWLHSS